MDHEHSQFLHQRAQSFGTSTHASAWGLVARNAPIALLVARVVNGEQRWEHVMKLNLLTLELEHGAWSTMRITPSRCEISANGRFWKYHAKGTNEGFPRECGGTTIARVPWLAALTDVEQDVSGTKYYVPGDDALEAQSQKQLHKLFQFDSLAGVTVIPGARHASFIVFESVTSEKALRQAEDHANVQEVRKREIGAHWLWMDHQSLLLYPSGQRSTREGIIRLLKHDKVIFEFDCRELQPKPCKAPDAARADITPLELRDE